MIDLKHVGREHRDSGRLPDPGWWGLSASDSNELTVGGISTVQLAKEYGTPLHVVNEDRLNRTAANFLETVRAVYRGSVSVFYALKCNSVPAVVETIRSAGLNAEVMTEFELDLALGLGYVGREIIVNGPCKTDRFLAACLANNVRFIIVDSLQELTSLDRLARSAGKNADVLLRINPGLAPRGINGGTATGSRRCAFGFDIESGEASHAFAAVRQMKSIRVAGLHLHIGTGIRRAGEYRKTLRRLKPVLDEAARQGLNVRVLDVGGGFASSTTRELRTHELVASQMLHRLPGCPRGEGCGIEEFARTISETVEECFTGEDLPELLFEPGRCIASSNQFLLLTIQRTKSRKGVGRWLIADGGLSTVTLPTYYELHEVFLCDDVRRPRAGKATLIGPACFSGDIIYKDKPMPRVEPGEIIAIMDSGAYFTALESSFGFPRPAIVAVSGGGCRLIRERESFDDMLSRDIITKGYCHEIRNR